MSSTVEPRLLKGFRDIPPAQMAVRQQMITAISRTMERFGFLPLETPVLEYADILLGKLGDEGEKLLYQFEDHGQRQVAMRYDLTVPLARFVAQNPQLTKPFKRYQVGPVWRADNTQRGRYREFYQFDADIVGTDSPLADAEILTLMQQVLLDLGVKDFVIRVNDRRIINAFANSLQLNASQTKGFFKVLDNLEKVDWDDSKARLHELGLSSFDIDRIKHELVNNQLDLAEQAPQLHQIITYAQDLGLDPQYIKFDPSIVRGLDYYSGIVFETSLTKVQGFGSIFSGGRYDDLVSRFSPHQFPAIGTSVGLDRLTAALEEVNALPQAANPIQVHLTLFDDSPEATQATLAATNYLRQHGFNCSASYQSSSIGKQCKAAAEAGIPWAIIIGRNELANNQVTLRNLNQQTETTINLDQVAAAINH